MRSRWAVLLGLAVLAFGLRAYRLPELTVFQGDQGIDALAARHLVLNGVWPLEGPATSAGGVHLGPLYYWLLALPMVFGGFDPTVEAVQMVALNTLAVVVLFWLLLLWFGPRVALAGAVLYAVSPAAIVAARSAWNPAPAPLFLVLALLGLAQSNRTHDAKWLVLVGFALGCLIQFHYFTLGVVVVCLGFAACEVAHTRAFGWGALGALVFVLLLAPYAIHELLTGLPDVHAAANLASASAPTVVQDSIPRRLYAVLALGLVGGFLANNIEPLAAVLTLLLLTALVLGRRTYPYVLIAALLGVTLLQVVAYRGPIFAHYFVPLAPLLYVALSAGLALLNTRFLVPATVALLALNLSAAPIRDEPLNHVARTEAVARTIAARTGEAPFNLWLQSPNDKDAAYRYQLERLGLAPDPSATRLFLICQDQPCDRSGLGQTSLYDVTLLELQ